MWAGGGGGGGGGEKSINQSLKRLSGASRLCKTNIHITVH